MKWMERFLWAWLIFMAMAGFPRQALARTGEAEEMRNQAAADALFTNGIPHRLKIEIPRAGVRSLQQDPRAYVKATLREGAIVYSNILIRLKGGAGSFRGLDDKPGFTLKLEKESGVFHGLSKFHLNNSVQDDTHLSEWICSEMFRAAGVPAARAAHAVVDLNGRPLGFYVLVESVNRVFLARYSKDPHGNVYGQSPNADITEPLERMGGNENTNGVVGGGLSGSGCGTAPGSAPPGAGPGAIPFFYGHGGDAGSLGWLHSQREELYGLPRPGYG
jgi:hypothetical protein